MERVAPRQVLYENQLPLAIASKSSRRIFYPEGPATFGPQGSAYSNIVRIPINADSLLDVQNSYLQFDITNTEGNHDTFGADFGFPCLERLRIESAGVTLEDITSYNKLYGGVLLPCQASLGGVKDATITQLGLESTIAGLSDIAVANNTSNFSTPPTQDEVRAGITATKDLIVTAVNNMTQTSFLGRHQADTNHDADNGTNPTRTYNVPLVSALLNLDKYLPLVMMNAGIVLELHLSVPNALGCSSANRPLSWTMSNVKYIAHMIDLERDFYDKLRMVMETSGNNLQLTGTTFRSFRSTQGQSATEDYNINIPARIKSIKSIFFTHTNSANRYGTQVYGIGSAIPNGVEEYQFRVGSMLYPSTAVKCGVNNKGEAYQELRKAFGNINDYQHGGALVDNSTFYLATNTAEGGTASTAVLTPYALDFESFPRTALENGLNSADRSLPITLEIKRNGGSNVVGGVDVDVFVMCDAVFYVNVDGSVSVSI